jgi:hypothetical protein
MPAVLWKALKSGSQLNGVTLSSRAWYFPNRSNGFASVPLAAEIVVSSSFAEKVISPQLAAAVYDERQRVLLGTSADVLELKPATDRNGRDRVLRGYWLNTIDLPPGPYELRAAVLDRSTGAVGSSSWRFLVHPPDPQAGLAVSSMVLARECISQGAQSASRRDLLDPLVWRDCRLQPTPSDVFLQGDTLRALLRLYPTGDRMKDFPQGWQAKVSYWEAGKGTPVSFPVPIEAVSGSGWAAYAELALSNLGLKAGDYQINIAITGPHPEQAFSLQSRFQIVGDKE